MTPLETRQPSRPAKFPFEGFGSYFKALRQLHVDSASGQEAQREPAASALADRTLTRQAEPCTAKP
jgi:hypothetical protein